MKRHIWVFFFLASIYGPTLATSIRNNNSRIIGGEDANRRQFTSIVSIQLSGLQVHFSAGSIIAPKWVLSAASYFEGITDLEFDIFAGMLVKGEDNDDVQVRSTDLIVLHPEFDSPDNDVALLRVSEAFEFGNAVQPIALDCGRDGIAPGEAVTSAGWGTTTDEASGLPDHLQYLEMSVTTNAECQGIVGDRRTITDRMACAMPFQTQQTNCANDEGNPLIRRLDGTLVGVQIWRLDGCGLDIRPVIPNVFARVGSYLEFVLQETGEDLCGWSSTSTDSSSISTNTADPPSSSSSSVGSTADPSGSTSDSSVGSSISTVPSSSSISSTTETATTPDGALVSAPSIAVSLVCLTVSAFALVQL